MKRKTARALLPATGRSRGMRPIDVVARLRSLRDQVALLHSDIDARLQIIEVEAADEQRTAFGITLDT